MYLELKRIGDDLLRATTKTPQERIKVLEVEVKLLKLCNHGSLVRK